MEGSSVVRGEGGGSGWLLKVECCRGKGECGWFMGEYCGDCLV